MIDMAEAIRGVILTDTAITAELTTYKGSYPVFTRRPAPEDTPWPVILVSPQIGPGVELDYVDDGKLREIVRDISVYGFNDDAVNYRQVETIAFAVLNLFHRLSPHSISMPAGWRMVQSLAYGPVDAPADDPRKTGRLVSVKFLVASV